MSGAGVPKVRAPRRLVGPAERRTNGIYENQIRLAEQGVWIVDPPVGRLSGASVTRPTHPLRTKPAKLLPTGGYSGRTGEEEQHGAHGGISDAILGIGGVKQMGFREARGGITQRHVADASGVGEGFSVDRNLLVRFGGRGIGNRRRYCARGRIVVVKLAGTGASARTAATSSAPRPGAAAATSPGQLAGGVAAVVPAAARPRPPWPHAVNETPAMITNRICPLCMYRIRDSLLARGCKFHPDSGSNVA